MQALYRRCVCVKLLQKHSIETKLTSFTLISQGLEVLDKFYKLWTECNFNPQAFDPECTKWVLLLLRLVDVTGDSPALHFQRFLGKTSAGVVKKYQQDIIQHVSTRETASCRFVIGSI